MKTKKESRIIKQCRAASRAVNKAEQELHRLKLLCVQSCKPMTGRTRDIQSLVATVDLMMIDLGRDISNNTKEDWI